MILYLWEQSAYRISSSYLASKWPKFFFLTKLTDWRNLRTKPYIEAACCLKIGCMQKTELKIFIFLKQYQVWNFLKIFSRLENLIKKFRLDSYFVEGVKKRSPTKKILLQEFCQLYISIIWYNPHQTVASCFGLSVLKGKLGPPYWF